MATQNEIEKDQYQKINTLTAKVEQLTSAVDITNQLMMEYIKIFKKILVGAFIIIITLIGALIFGAIGKEGLYAVRDTIPKVTTSFQAIPWHDDLSPWIMRHSIRLS